MKSEILVSAILSITIAIPTNAQYTPPVNSNQKQRARTQVIRGCEGQTASIELIVPTRDKIKTSRNNPTFFIELSEIPPTPLIVSITHSNKGGTVYYREFTPTKAGRLALETSGNLPQGQYILTIGYFCQRNPDRAPIYLRVAFEKVDLTPQQQKLLSSSQDRQKLLQQWGLNYDALELEYSLVNR